MSVLRTLKPFWFFKKFTFFSTSSADRFFTPMVLLFPDAYVALKNGCFALRSSVAIVACGLFLAKSIFMTEVTYVSPRWLDWKKFTIWNEEKDKVVTIPTMFSLMNLRTPLLLPSMSEYLIRKEASCFVPFNDIADKASAMMIVTLPLYLVYFYFFFNAILFPPHVTTNPWRSWVLVRRQVGWRVCCRHATAVSIPWHSYSRYTYLVYL